MIKIKNLNKYYNKNKANELHVINNVNLEISDTGLVTFLGSSGAGKSTLLHVIGGLDKAKGDVIYDNVNVIKNRRNLVDDYRNKYIGYIFQNYNLLPSLTVYENLKIQLELINITDKAIVDEKINECLKIVGLEKYKRRKVTALSGGQQQRVSIARALVKGAKVIIADEPTGNLDTRNSIEILNILKVLSKRYLVILVTHNVNLAYHYSDRILKVKDGTIVEDIENKNNDSLLHVDSNAIYIKDFKKENLDKNINVFTKNNENININIVIENDAIYIENNNNLPIRVINENTDKYIIDKELEEDIINDETVLNLNYQSYNKQSFKETIKSLFNDIKNSFIKVMFSNRKGKLLHIAFIFIGLILCLCLNSLSISTTISNEYLSNVSKGAVSVDLANSSLSSEFGFSLEEKEVVSIIHENPEITGLVDFVDHATFYFKVISNRTTSIKIDNKCYVSTPKIYNREDIKLENEEVVISDEIAKKILSYTRGYGITTYEQLKGKEFIINIPKVYDGKAIIKDVILTSDFTFLISDYKYLSMNTTIQQATYLNYECKDIKNWNEITVPSGDVYYKDPYLPGVIINKNLVDVFIGIDYFSSTDKQKVWKTYSDKFTVLGYVEEEGFNVYFSNEDSYNLFVQLSVPTVQSYLPYENYEIKLTENSRLPENDFEILLPYTIKNLNKYKIGDKYRYTENFGGSIDLKIVGFFELEYPSNISHLYTNYRTAYMIRSISIYQRLKLEKYKSVEFYSNDIPKSIETFTQKGYTAIDCEKTGLQNTIFEKINISKLVIIISVSILVSMIIFLFFINRSKMMSNIYDIGVLRALGAKKRKIYKEYLIESIIVTTFTVVLGFTVAYFFTYNADKFIPGISVDLEYYFISVAIIYSVMIIASLLPIMTLLRKTPMEIINKYDI